MKVCGERFLHKISPVLFVYCLYYVFTKSRPQELLKIYHEPLTDYQYNISSLEGHHVQRNDSSSRLNLPFRMLLGIWSMDTPEGILRRKLIRSTYLSFEKQLQQANVTNIAQRRSRICSLADLQLGNFPDSGDCQLVYTFVIGAADKTDPQARTERVDGVMTIDRSASPDFERDSTYLNIIENLEKGKTTTWFAYGSSPQIADSLQISLIAKVDSDTMMYPARFLDQLEHHNVLSPKNKKDNKNARLQDPVRGIYGGHLLPKTLFHYYQGGLYFMSKDVARNITSTTCNRVELVKEELLKWDHPAEDRSVGHFVQECCDAGSIHRVSLNTGIGWDHSTNPFERLNLKREKYFRVVWERYVAKEIAKAKFEEVMQAYASSDHKDCPPEEAFLAVLNQIGVNNTRVRRQYSNLVEELKSRCTK